MTAARVGHGVTAVLTGAAVVLSAGPVDASAAPTTLVAGRPAIVSVAGFAPGARVERRLDNVPLQGMVRANPKGVVRVRFIAPFTRGRHQLVVVGHVAAGRRAVARLGPASATVDPQAIVVMVPRLVRVTLRVVAASGVDAVSRSRDGGRGGLGTAGASAVAQTGSNVLVPTVLGGVLVLAGAVVTLAGRTRRART